MDPGPYRPYVVSVALSPMKTIFGDSQSQRTRTESQLLQVFHQNVAAFSANGKWQLEAECDSLLSSDMQGLAFWLSELKIFKLFRSRDVASDITMTRHNYARSPLSPYRV